MLRVGIMKEQGYGKLAHMSSLAKTIIGLLFISPLIIGICFSVQTDKDLMTYGPEFRCQRLPLWPGQPLFAGSGHSACVCGQSPGFSQRRYAPQVNKAPTYAKLLGIPLPQTDGKPRLPPCKQTAIGQKPFPILENTPSNLHPSPLKKHSVYTIL